MEFAVLICLVAVVLLVLGLALAACALAIARTLSLRLEDLRRQISTLENEVDRLKRTSAVPRKPVSTPEAAGPRLDTAAAAREASPVVPKMPPRPEPGPAVAETAHAPSDIRDSASAGASDPTAGVARARDIDWPAAKRFRGVQLEQFMGVKLFAWVGGFALFLAVAFFVKYSFDNNLISPELRVTAGFLFGVGLLVGGVLLKRKAYAVTSRTLVATGIVVLYSSSFASHGFYGLIGAGFAFVLMTLVTVTAFLLAVRLNAMVVAILGVLGGFLTPAVLSSGVDDPLALFGYIAILDIGLVAVALNRRWHFLVTLGALCTVFTQIGWAAQFFESEKASTALTILLVFNAIFLAASVTAERRQQGNRWFAVAAAALPLVTFGFALFFLAFEDLGSRPGNLFLCLLMADLFLFAQAVSSSGWRAGHLAGAAAAFFLLALWTIVYLREALLNWALGAFLGFALLHTVPPLIIPALRASRWQVVARIPVISAIPPFLLLVLATLKLDLGDPSPVFGLALLLVAVSLALTRSLKLDLLAPVTLACVLTLEYVWYDNRFTVEHATSGVAWFVMFFAVFQAFPFIFRSKFRDRVLVWSTAAIAGPLHFLGVYRMIDATWPNDVMGLLPAAFAVPALLSLRCLENFLPVDAKTRRSVLAWFGGCALFFITLIFPIQFEKQWITLGWALEGVALLWLYGRLPHPGLRGWGLALLALAFLRLAANPAVLRYHPQTDTPILNWYLYAYGVVAACLFVGGRLLAPPRNEAGGRTASPILRALGTILVFLLVNLEIADFFSEGSTLTFQFSGNFARDMTYSISWALFALGLLVAGVWKDLPSVRYAGMALMATTLLKLFLHDLVRLSAPYRIGAFLAVAVISILASVLYQRFFSSEPPRKEGAGDSEQ